jgi:ribose transport system ATP-binding protein
MYRPAGRTFSEHICRYRETRRGVAMSDRLTTGSEARIALAVQSVSKAYGATRALRDVSFEVGKGELHALVGGNGSGKSTMVKILAGVEASDPGGSVTVFGREVDANAITPHLARTAGLHFVHQDPAVFPDMTVADNLFLGGPFPVARAGHISRRGQRRAALEILTRFDVQASPDELMAGLSASKRTMVAIARALKDQEELHSGILVLDEPTASLPEQEAQALLDTLRLYAKAGQSVIYITHHLDEILSIADTVTVLRDGRHIVTRPEQGLTEAQLIEYIVGRSLAEVYPTAGAAPSGGVALELRGVGAGPLNDVDLTVRSGEVVGIAGLLGSGRSSLLHTIFGDRPMRTGIMLLDGEPVHFGRPADAMKAGIGLVPEDRANEALFSEQTVRENLSAASAAEFVRHGRLDTAAEGTEANRLITELGIKVGSPEQPVSVLSGGNQQKVIFARWLRRRPRLLLLDEPTQGVDVGARAEIYQLIRKAVSFGAAVLIVSSDFEELAGVCDRIAIVRRGLLAEEVTGPNIDPTRLSELIFAREAGIE